MTAEIETAWCDLKIAFDVNDDEAIWDAPDDCWPAGWELNQTDASGARVVAVFRVDHLPTEDEARAVANILANIGAA